MNQSPFSNGVLLPCEDAAGWRANLGTANVVASTPASAAATGTTGTIAWDASFIYVCVATNTWKRVAIATWP